ncbi:MAG: PVC-type heme-binding CxxCH protein [Planctomycetaceae bacterium]
MLPLLLLTLTAILPQPPETTTPSPLPASQPLEPDQALHSFQLQQNFQLQLVAAEPLTTDPVAAAFDEDGRLFVVEMNDYPYTDKSTDQPGVERTTDLPIGKIRLLSDDNDDGVFDRSTIFARDLSWPTGVVVWKDGIFVAAAPDLWWLRDADHDGVAEIRQRILTGFRKLNVQAVANNLLWTLDHQICGAGGTNGGLLSGSALDPHSPSPLSMSRHDFQFSPLGPPHHFQLLSGGARFGNTTDDWGNRFICNIRNPVQHVLLPLEHLSRNPHFNPGSPLHDVAASGDQLPVYRTSPPEPWRIINAARLTGQGDPRMPRSEKNAAGYLTSACGVTVYRGDAWPPEFRSQVLLSDVAANLVHRQQLTPAGPTFSSQRLDQNCEFITSTDNWFRPVNFVHAPDGTLWLLDMYRETIEHPWSMPADLKAMLDLERGRDRGRIYRIAPPHFKRRSTPKLSQATTTELVRLLEHPNAWHRDTAARLLFQQQDPATPALLLQLLRQSPKPQARLQALSTLAATVAATPATATPTLTNQLHDAVLQLLDDQTPQVRRGALRIAALHSLSDLPLAVARSIREDSDPAVLFEAALHLHQLTSLQRDMLLRTLLKRTATDPWIRTAALCSAHDHELLRLLETLLQPQVRTDPAQQPLLLQLAGIVGARNQAAELRILAQALSNLPEQERSSARFSELLAALDDGLRRSRSSLAAAWQEQPAALDFTRSIVRTAGNTALDTALPAEQRTAAVRLLTLNPQPELLPQLLELAGTTQPDSVRLAALKLLPARLDQAAAAQLAADCPRSTTSLQHEIIECLCSSEIGTKELLQAIATGTIPASRITPIRRSLLLKHAQTTIRTQAEQLLGDSRTTPRSEIVAAWQDTLKLSPDSQQGRAVFQRECSSCHKLGTLGTDVGPSLLTVRHRTPAELLTHILDPNREVGPDFLQFVAVTHSGQTSTGILTAETSSALTLRRSGNQQDTINRSDIAELQSAGISLMPEGFELKLNRQELASLIHFIRTGN